MLQRKHLSIVPTYIIDKITNKKLGRIHGLFIDNEYDRRLYIGDKWYCIKTLETINDVNTYILITKDYDVTRYTSVIVEIPITCSFITSPIELTIRYNKLIIEERKVILSLIYVNKLITQFNIHIINAIKLNIHL